MKNRFNDLKFKKHPSWKKGPKFAKLKYSYINKLRKYCKVKNGDGELYIFLCSFLSSYGCSINHGGFCFLNKFTVEYILKHIRYFKKKGKWRLVK